MGAFDSKLIIRYSNYLKNAFCVVLQTALSDEFTPEAYRYSESVQDRQVSIYKAFPRRTTKYPIIWVEAGAGTLPVDKLGDDEIVDESENSATYAGDMTIPMKISIEAETPTDRDFLTDLIAIYVRYVFRELFHRYQIHYIGIEGGEEGEEDRDSSKTGKVFKGFVSVQCFVHFNQEIDKRLIEKIESIDLSQATIGTNTEDQTPLFGPEEE